MQLFSVTLHTSQYRLWSSMSFGAHLNWKKVSNSSQINVPNICTCNFAYELKIKPKSSAQTYHRPQLTNKTTTTNTGTGSIKKNSIKSRVKDIKPDEDCPNNTSNQRVFTDMRFNETIHINISYQLQVVIRNIPNDSWRYTQNNVSKHLHMWFFMLILAKCK